MDAVVSQFGIRVMPTGSQTPFLLARFPPSRNPTRKSLGRGLTLAQMRNEARRWLQLLDEGKNPAVEKANARRAEQLKRANTFAAVADDFTRLKLAHERKGRECTRQLERFVDLWGDRPITEITRGDVRAVIEAARGTLYQAHNLLLLLKRFLGWAVDREAYGLEVNVAAGLKAKVLIGSKLARDRVLDNREWPVFWRAACAMPYPYGPLLKLLALTAARRSEWSAARWREVDFGARLFVVPASRQKMARPHSIPLTASVLEILEGLPRFGGDFLFSTTGGKRPVDGFSRAKSALDQLMRAELGEQFRPFVLHDIRRSARTQMSALPIPSDIAELTLGHRLPLLRAVYDLHAYEAERRRALELWEARLRSIVEPPPDNVVPIEAARR
jgi:integrase